MFSISHFSVHFQCVQNPQANMQHSSGSGPAHLFCSHALVLLCFIYIHSPSRLVFLLLLKPGRSSLPQCLCTFCSFCPGCTFLPFHLINIGSSICSLHNCDFLGHTFPDLPTRSSNLSLDSHHTGHFPSLEYVTDIILHLFNS